MEELNDRIRDLRRKNGYSQEALAQKVGVVRQTISKWESGLAQPGISELMSMCNIFGVPIEYFISSGGETAAATAEIPSVEEHEEVKAQLKPRSAAPYILGIVFFSLVSIVLAILAFYIGFSAFSPRDGFAVVQTNAIDGYWLIVCVGVWIAFTIADIICCIEVAKISSERKKIKNVN